MRTERVVGTLVYMAPEAHRGSYCDKGDVFALGVVILEALTGEEPGAGEGRADIVTRLEEPLEGGGTDDGMLQFLDGR
jgi:serine/threonine protein kinase